MNAGYDTKETFLTLLALLKGKVQIKGLNSFNPRKDLFTNCMSTLYSLLQLLETAC